MSNNEKAVKRLESLDINAKIENGCVYVTIGDVSLELSDFEVFYQATEFDKMLANGYEF
jgi:hypothetical protein